MNFQDGRCRLDMMGDSWMVGCWGLLPSFGQANSVLGKNATHIAIAEVLPLSRKELCYGSTTFEDRPSLVFPRYFLGDTVGKGHAHPGQPKMARL